MDNLFSVGVMVWTYTNKLVEIKDFELLCGVFVYYTSDGSAYAEHQLSYELKCDYNEELDKIHEENYSEITKYLAPQLLSKTPEQHLKEYIEGLKMLLDVSKTGTKVKHNK